MSAFIQLFETLDGAPVKVVITEDTVNHLKTTCFRGKGRAFAGNFAFWKGPSDLFSDERFREKFREEITRTADKIADNLRYNGVRRTSFTINCGEVIGWWTTARPVPPAYALERFAPKRGSTALRIRPRMLKAPQTTLVGVYCKVQFKEDEGWIVFIYSICPGRHVGMHAGDITKREGVAFFSPHNPGEPLHD